VKRLIAFHSSRRPVLDPLTRSPSLVGSTRRDPTTNEPIVDTNLPTFAYTVKPVHLLRHTDLVLPGPPAFPESPSAECFPLVRQAFQLCCAIPAWEDPDADCTAKGFKSACLQSLAQTIFSNSSFLASLPSDLSDLFFVMITKNLFRAIPETPAHLLAGDVEPTMIDIARDHLLLVYPLLIRYFSARPNDPHFDDAFQHRALALLEAPDWAERELVVAFLLEWVSTFPEREEAVWKAMSAMLIEYRQNMRGPYAVLAVLAFFLPRFRAGREDLAPLRNQILRRALLPLRSGYHLVSYIAKLSAVLDFFIERDPGFALKLTKVLIDTFPFGCVAKQVPYTQWIIQITEKVLPTDFPHLCGPLFALMAELAVSDSSKVVEASFKIFQNIKIIPMIMDNTNVIFPVMVAAVSRTMNEHWKLSTQNHAFAIIRAMQDLDPGTFEELKLGIPAKKKRERPESSREDQKAHKQWAAIARSAARADGSIQPSKVLVNVAQQFARRTVLLRGSIGW
jgi:hypothetical protein